MVGLGELIRLEKDYGLRSDIIADFAKLLVKTAPQDAVRRSIADSLRFLVRECKLAARDVKHIWESLIGSTLAMPDVANLVNHIFEEHIGELPSVAQLKVCMDKFQSAYLAQSSVADVREACSIASSRASSRRACCPGDGAPPSVAACQPSPRSTSM